MVDKVVGVTPAGLVLAPGDARPAAGRRRRAAGRRARRRDRRAPEHRRLGRRARARPPARLDRGGGRARQPPRRGARARLLGRRSAATSPRRRSTSCTSAPPAPSVRDTTGRWISKKTWDFLTTKLSSGDRRRAGPRPPRHAVAHRHRQGRRRRDAGEAGRGRAGRRTRARARSPFEQLDASGAVLQTRRSAPANELGPIGGDAATGDEHARHRRRRRSRCASRPSRPRARCGSAATATCLPPAPARPPRRRWRSQTPGAASRSAPT